MKLAPLFNIIPGYNQILASSFCGFSNSSRKEFFSLRYPNHSFTGFLLNFCRQKIMTEQTKIRLCKIGTVRWLWQQLSAERLKSFPCLLSGNHLFCLNREEIHILGENQDVSPPDVVSFTFQHVTIVIADNCAVFFQIITVN